MKLSARLRSKLTRHAHRGQGSVMSPCDAQPASNAGAVRGERHHYQARSMAGSPYQALSKSMIPAMRPSETMRFPTPASPGTSSDLLDAVSVISCAGTEIID